MGRLTPPQLLILSFLCVITLGTIALLLPISTRGSEGIGLIDSLFTATSATCVTGLVVQDTGTYFSRFGQTVIFCLFQAGGLGIMTFSTLFAVMLGRKIGFRENDIIRSTLNRQRIIGLKKLLAYILLITITTEIIGAVALFLRWRAITDWPLIDTARRAIFHSVSGFCNAGFSLFSTSLTQFRADYVTNLIMIFLIFIGGIGFIVIMDLMGLFLTDRSERRLSLQSKIALTTSISLIVIGAAFICFFERENLMRTMAWGERFWSSVFQSVTARTAGFNTLPTGELSVPSKLVTMFLMFIGASPGSTGGGIKTCTFAVIAVTVLSMLRKRKRMMVFDRSIPRQVIREALVIFFLAVSWIFVAVVVLTYVENMPGANGSTFLKALFEVTSAFGTVGLSAGGTASLSSLGKLCITITMFAGRLGPLTLALAVAFRDKKDTFIFPEENLMVG